MQRVISRVHRSIVPPGEQGSSAIEGNAAVASDIKQEIQDAVDGLQFATILGERKSAVATLDHLVTKYSLSSDASHHDGNTSLSELSKRVVPVSLAALTSDPRDTELMESMLELLQKLVSSSSDAALPLLSLDSIDPEMIEQLDLSFTGLQLCLDLLQDPSPWIRGPSVLLIKLLQEAQRNVFASTIVDCNEGFRRLLETVEDRQEHIRDAALQVLSRLTEREKNMQQFLAFEDGFTRLFGIIQTEDMDDNGSVAADCLQIVNNMIRDNVMTQTLLLDIPDVLSSHLPFLLAVNVSGDIPDQRKRSIKLTLQLLRYLLSGIYEGVRESQLDDAGRRDQTKKDAELYKIQSVLGRQDALVDAIVQLACADTDHFMDVQVQALDVLNLLVAHHQDNQVRLVHFKTAERSKSLLSELLRMELTSEETTLSSTSSQLLDSILLDNQDARTSLLQQVHAVDESVPSGKRLLDACVQTSEEVLIENRYPSVRQHVVIGRKASERLRSLLADSDSCKELALRFPSNYNDTEVSVVKGGLLFTRLLKLATTSTSSDVAYSQLKISLLVTLMYWTKDCSKAAEELTSSVGNMMQLLDCIHADSTNEYQVQVAGLSALLFGCCLLSLDATKSKKLLDLVSQTVGLDVFCDAFISTQQTSIFFSCSHKRPRKKSMDEEELLYLPPYDHAFTLLFKEMSDKVQRKMMDVYTTCADGEEAKAYQKIIRMQDEELQQLKEQLSNVQTTGTSEDWTEEKKQWEAQVAEDKRRYEAKVSVLQSEKEEMEKRLEEMANKLTDAKKSKQGEDLTHAKEQVEKLERELYSARKSFKEEQEKSRGLEEHLESVNSEWEATSVQLQKDLNTLRKQLDVKSNECDDLKRQFASYNLQKEEDGTTSTSSTAWQESLAPIEDRNDRRSSVDSTLQMHTPGDLSDMMASVMQGALGDGDNESADEIFRLWEKQRSRTRNLKEMVAELGEEKAWLEEQLRASQNYTEQVVSQLEQVEETLHDEAQYVKTEVYEEERGEKEAMQKELMKVKEEKKRLEDEVETLKSEVEEVEKKMKVMASRREKEESETTAEDGSDDLRKEMASMQEEKERLGTKVEEQEKELEELRVLVDEMESVCERSLKQIEDSQTEIDALKSEKEDLQKAEDERLRLASRVEELEKTQTVSEEAQSRLNELEKTQGRLKELEEQVQESHKTRQELDDLMEEKRGWEERETEALMLLASLEIQCSTLCATLREGLGKEAVESALALSREKGALVN